MTARPGIVGFSLHRGIDREALLRHDGALQAALRHFPWLKRAQYAEGHSTLQVWDHGEVDDRVHRDSDGSLLALVGSPANQVAWLWVEAALKVAAKPSDFVLPWKGRVLLVRISAEGSWRMWNDWAGSIPVFHARVGQGLVLSTLEPVVVTTAGYTPDDFSLPGMLALLSKGHFLGTATLFDGMATVSPDSVTEWRHDVCNTSPLRSVEPSDTRWESNWDALVEEMHALTWAAVMNVLRESSRWLLPLSAGLDSRLIAAIGSRQGIRFRAYTFGPPEGEAIAARRVAQELGIPWQRIGIGSDYLIRYTHLWCDWFGSSMHLAGMHQMPFLEHLPSQEDGRLLHGYLGDVLTGEHAERISSGDKGDPVAMWLSLFPSWRPLELRSLFRRFPADAWGSVKDAVQREYDLLKGSDYQRLRCLDIFNRHRLWTSYGATMYDYWRGVGTPYLDRDYARFCLSLPSAALKGRRLLKAMIQRHYPRLACIAGTYGLTISPYPFERALRSLSRRLPPRLLFGPLLRFGPCMPTWESDALKATGEEALWPLDVVWQDLGQWFNIDVLERYKKAALQGDWKSYRRLAPVQAIALHVHRDRVGTGLTAGSCHR